MRQETNCCTMICQLTVFTKNITGKQTNLHRSNFCHATVENGNSVLDINLLKPGQHEYHFKDIISSC